LLLLLLLWGTKAEEDFEEVAELDADSWPGGVVAARGGGGGGGGTFFELGPGVGDGGEEDLVES